MKLQLYTRSAVHLLGISMCMWCCRFHSFAFAFSFAFAPVSTHPLSHRSISTTILPTTIAIQNNVGRPSLASLTAKNNHDHDRDDDSESVSEIILEAPTTCVEVTETDNTESDLVDRNRIAHEHSRVLINVFTWIALVVESVIIETRNANANANANATPSASASASTPISS